MHACMVHAHSLLVVVSCIVASADTDTVRAAANVPHRLRKIHFPEHPPEYRPLMRPSSHSTDIIVGFLRVTQIDFLY